MSRYMSTAEQIVCVGQEKDLGFSRASARRLTANVVSTTPNLASEMQISADMKPHVD